MTASDMFEVIEFEKSCKIMEGHFVYDINGVVYFVEEVEGISRGFVAVMAVDTGEHLVLLTKELRLLSYQKGNRLEIYNHKTGMSYTGNMSNLIWVSNYFVLQLKEFPEMSFAFEYNDIELKL